MNTLDTDFPVSFREFLFFMGRLQSFFHSVYAYKVMMLGAAVTMLVFLGGCSSLPQSVLAPVEDHGVKSIKKDQLAPEPIETAKTTPLPSIEDYPLRARPLPPLPSMISGATRPPTPSTDDATPSVPPLVPVPSAPSPQRLSQPVPPTTPPVASSPVSVPTTKTQPEIQSPPAQRPSASSSNTGVVALLGKADDQAASGQIDSAAVTLERALRIEPENGRLWNELAGIRLKQGKLDAAISMAEKSNSMARNQRDLQARNWRLIAVARQKQGQSQAAAEALLRARSMEGGHDR
ncbi:hypothetical protein CCP3SC5AM1_1200009 [Gammaproteobacteria bacterium]